MRLVSLERYFLVLGRKSSPYLSSNPHRLSSLPLTETGVVRDTNGWWQKKRGSRGVQITHLYYVLCTILITYFYYTILQYTILYYLPLSNDVQFMCTCVCVHTYVYVCVCVWSSKLEIKTGNISHRGLEFHKLKRHEVDTPVNPTC